MDTLNIVIDMQNDFLTGSLANPHAYSLVPLMRDFIKECEDKNEVVLFTLDTHYDNYLETKEGIMLPIKHCIINTEGHKVEQSLLNASKNKYQVLKPTFGMTSTLLTDTILKYFNNLSEVKKVRLVGTCTDICVVSNALALKALLPDATIEVYENLTSGVNKQLHDAAILTMKSCQILIKRY